MAKPHRNENFCEVFLKAKKGEIMETLTDTLNSYSFLWEKIKEDEELKEIQFNKKWIKPYMVWLKEQQFLLYPNLCKEKGKKMRTPTSHLEAIRNGEIFIGKNTKKAYNYNNSKLLTQKAFKKHLLRERKEDTLYLINSFYQKRILCLIDIDTHKNGTIEDAYILAEKIIEELPYDKECFYLEPSSNLTGIHVYFISTNKPNHTQYFQQFISRIHSRISTKEYNTAKIDTIYGQPTVWEKDKNKWKIKTAGTVVKIPYCFNGFNSLFNLKPLYPSRLNYIKEKNTKQKAQKQPTTTIYNLEGTLNNKCCLRPKNEVLLFENFFESPSKNIPFIKEMLGNKLVEWKRLTGRERKRHLVTELFRMLNRPISLEECICIYEKLNLNTGERNSRRIEDMSEIIEYYSKTFIPAHSMANSNFKNCKLILTKEIELAIGENEGYLNKVNYPRKIRVDELAATLFYFIGKTFERPLEERYENGVPIEGLIGFLNFQRNIGLVKNKCGYQKASALRQIMCNLNFVECIDDNYDWDKAKKYKMKNKERWLFLIKNSHSSQENPQ